eukprot:GILK01011865.1.p1 GENE.GILK01011865.1~~GILK01011865.1.p1  ORF type:complete len:235 (+),score=22.61 GILK01011865.1:51-707(+)
MAASASASHGQSKLMHAFYKTKLCPFFSEGECSKGAECTFAHGDEELRALPDLRKTKLCPNYQKGHCDDAECAFAHGDLELKATSDVYKTSLCTFFAQGKCKAGAHCRHAHGEQELRPGRTRPRRSRSARSSNSSSSSYGPSSYSNNESEAPMSDNFTPLVPVYMPPLMHPQYLMMPSAAQMAGNGFFPYSLYYNNSASAYPTYDPRLNGRNGNWRGI